MNGVYPLTKSWVSVFLKCPWRAWTEAMWKMAPRGGSAAGFGALCHDARGPWLTTGDSGGVGGSSRWPDDVKTLVLDMLRLHPDPHPRTPQWIEKTVALDSNGHVATPESAVFLGTLDWIFLDDQDEYHVIAEDLKTGKWETDDQFERDLYSLLAIAEVVMADSVTFRRYWARSGNLPSWKYDKTDLSLALERITEIASLVTEAEPDPTPGPHCDSWYGAPCVFRDNGCPLKSSAILAPEEVVAGRELLLSFMSTPQRAEENVAAMATNGLLAMSTFQAALRKACKAWVDARGPVQLPDGRKWGQVVHNKSVLDAEIVLRALLDAQVPVADIARAVNISTSSMIRLRSRYPEVVKHIQGTALDSSLIKYDIIKEVPDAE
jgi:hypothetical protein